VDGMDMGKLTGWLWNSHKISTAGLNHAEFTGIRVTPNVYTTLDEIDRFVEVMQGILRTDASSPRPAG